MKEVTSPVRYVEEQLARILSVARIRPFETSTAEGRSKERYRRILLTTASSIGTRALTALVGLFTVPLALSYLGKEQFGLWAVVTSLIAWTSLFDFGIVNSLVNALSEAHGRNNREEAKSYVSTAFFILLAVSCGLGIVLALCARWISWSSLLAVRAQIPQSTVMWTVVAAFACVLAGLPLTIVRQIYAGFQKSYIGNLFNVLGAILTLAFLILVIHSKSSLPAMVLAFAGPPVLVGVSNLVYLVRKEMPWIAPALSQVSRKALRRLLATSTPLFLFQIGSLLVNETQLIVLAHVTSLQTVSECSIVWRLSVTLSSLVGLGTSAFVPAFREAHERGDGIWMRAGFRRMLFLRMLIACGIALILIWSGNSLLHFWLRRRDFTFPAALWIIQALTVVSTIWVTSFADFLTIMDRIWVQVCMVLVNGFVTIVLTFVLAPRFGLIGAVISIGFVTVCFWTWLVPILVKQFFYSTASGTRAGYASELT
jgi:O-antigen/teichoic acid export membrane protein